MFYRLRKYWISKVTMAFTATCKGERWEISKSFRLAIYKKPPYSNDVRYAVPPQANKSQVPSLLPLRAFLGHVLYCGS